MPPFSLESLRVHQRKLPPELRPEPSETQKTQWLDEAADAVEGKIWFRHNGIQPLLVGRSRIDWTGGQYAHQEWKAQLWRFHFLRALAFVFRDAGDDRYVEAARDYLEDWLKHRPLQHGSWVRKGPDNMLSLAIRAKHWFEALPAFAGDAGFAGELEERLLESLHAQLDFLSGHLTTEGNWRLAQADSLVFASLAWPEAPGAAHWRETGVAVINDEYYRQVQADGAHCESTPGYHHWMLSLLEQYCRLGRSRPELGFRMSPERLVRMYEYAFATLRPDGRLNGWNDSQPLGIQNLASLQKQWERFARDAGLPAEPPCREVFPWARQAAFRDDRSVESCYWTFDGAPGQIPWHSHLARNALQLMQYGVPLLVDPGTLSYEASEPSTAHGRSTRAHNTVTLDGLNQCLAPCSTFRHLRTESADLALGQYDGGYWEGDFHWRFESGLRHGHCASHHRTILRMRKGGFIIIDHLIREPRGLPEPHPPRLEQNWQFTTAELEVTPDRASTRQASGNLLALFPSASPDSTLAVHCGERNPMRGWLPTGNGLQPAAQLCFSLPVPEKEIEIVTVLIPHAGSIAPAVSATVSTGSPRLISHARLEWPDGTVDLIEWTVRLRQPLGVRPDFQTDAPLVWRRSLPSGQNQTIAFGEEFVGKSPAASLQKRNFWNTAVSTPD